MLDSHIKMRHLRCFLETARLGSLTAAAQTLNVSQPAASKTIRELEDILAVPLFDRSGRRLALSPAGRIFQQHAGAAMIDLTRAQDMVREAPRSRTRLAVGILPTAATEIFPKAALRFQNTHPNCMMRVTTGPNWMLLSQLREGALDMIVGRMPAAAALDGLSFHHLYSDTVVPVVRPDHPLLRPNWPLSQLTAYPLMLPPSGAVISPMVRAFLHNCGISNPAPSFENVSLAFGRKVVQDSDVIWFISQGVVAAELKAGTLASLPLKDDLLGGPVGVCMREQTLITEDQKDLLATLVSAATPKGL